jgi:uncharacterized protein (DUF302 family)
MQEKQIGYAIKRAYAGEFEQAVEAVTAALAGEGFGILTDIDVKATLQKKLGVDFPKMRILGACNPPMAFEALKTEPDVSVLLPCNVVVRETEVGAVEIAAMDPRAALPMFGRESLRAFADEVARRIEKALDQLT